MKRLSLIFIAVCLVCIAYGQTSNGVSNGNNSNSNGTMSSVERLKQAYNYGATPSKKKDEKKTVDDEGVSIDEFGEEDEVDFYIPSDDIYGTWTNESLNPYRVDISNIPDSISIDCRGFVFPVAKMNSKHVTSEFGTRGRRYHYGTDIGLKKGDSIVSVFDGVVRLVAYDRGGYGNYIVVRHENGLESLYGHLSKSIAKPNQVVKAGELIGLGGSTGRSSGPHLHFEFRFLGNPFNTKHIIDYEMEEAHASTYCLTKSTFKYKAKADRLKKQNSVAGKKYHRIREGETLSHIAKRYGTTVGKLCKLNHITANTTIRAGRSIRYK